MRLSLAKLGRMALLLAVTWTAAGQALAQGPEFGGKKASKSAGSDVDSQEGLESATPTDNVNELNSGNAASPGGSESNAEGDFPAANDAKNFDLDGPQAGGDNSLNGATNPAAKGKGDKNGANGGDNFSNGLGGDATSNTPTKAPVNAAPTNSPATNVAPVNVASPTANLNAAPAPPANAEKLTNQAGAAPVNAAVPVSTDLKPADGKEELVQKPAEAPPVLAPPLPPPNEFSGAPPVPGTMRLMAEGEAPEEYTVDPGDTLYDICDQLLDEAAYWPKLWALNPEIKNPHFIFPNMRLRFYPGDDDTPPYLQVVTEDDVIPIDKGDLDEAELIAEKIVFPRDELLDEQVTEVIGPDGVEALADEILTAGKFYHASEVEVQVPGFIYAAEKDAQGYILGGRNGEINMAAGVKALVESAGGLSPGTIYSVIRPGGAIQDPSSGDFIGYKYYFIANLKVDHGAGEDVFIGVVQDSRLSVLPDDLVVNYISTKRSVPTNDVIGSFSAADAKVVAFDYQDQEMGGQGHYAFIDKGSSDGVSPGMYFPIYATPGYLTSAFGSMDLPMDFEMVGAMRIIDATDAGAVGYIVRSVREIRVGDRTSKN